MIYNSHSQVGFKLRLVMMMIALAFSIQAQFTAFDCLTDADTGGYFLDVTGCSLVDSFQWNESFPWEDIECDTCNTLYIVGDECCKDTSYHEWIFEGCENCEDLIASFDSTTGGSTGEVGGFAVDGYVGITFSTALAADQLIIRVDGIVVFDTGAMTSTSAANCPASSTSCGCATTHMGDYSIGDVVPLSVGSGVKTSNLGSLYMSGVFSGSVTYEVVAASCGSSSSAWSGSIFCEEPVCNIAATASITGDDCLAESTDSGAIDLDPTNPTNPPLSYVWSNGELSQDISGLSAGSYTVTIVDIQACQLVHTYVVPDLNDCPCPCELTLELDDPDCPTLITWTGSGDCEDCSLQFGAPDFNANVTSGSSPTFTASYDLLTNTLTRPNGSTSTAGNGIAGVYTLTMNDCPNNINCSETLSVTVDYDTCPECACIPTIALNDPDCPEYIEVTAPIECDGCSLQISYFDGTSWNGILGWNNSNPATFEYYPSTGEIIRNGSPLLTTTAFGDGLYRVTVVQCDGCDDAEYTVEFEYCINFCNGFVGISNGNTGFKELMFFNTDNSGNTIDTIGICSIDNLYNGNVYSAPDIAISPIGEVYIGITNSNGVELLQVDTSDCSLTYIDDLAIPATGSAFIDNNTFMYGSGTEIRKYDTNTGTDAFWTNISTIVNGSSHKIAGDFIKIGSKIYVAVVLQGFPSGYTGPLRFIVEYDVDANCNILSENSYPITGTITGSSANFGFGLAQSNGFTYILNGLASTSSANICNIDLPTGVISNCVTYSGLTYFGLSSIEDNGIDCQ